MTPKAAKQQSDILKHYFNISVESISWQNNVIVDAIVSLSFCR